MASGGLDRQKSSSSSISSDSGYESLTPDSLKENPDVVIQRNFSYLRDNVKVDLIKDWLIQTNTVNEYDRSCIENLPNSFVRSEELLKCMLRKGKDICRQFLLCIKKEEVGLCYVYTELRNRCVGPKPFFKRQLSSFKISKQHLIRHRKCILEELEPKDIADLLFEAEVLTVDDHDEIIKEGSRMKKGMKLLSILENKDERFLDSFLHALEIKNSKEILRVLHEDKQSNAGFKKVEHTVLLVQQSYRFVVRNIHCDILIEHLRNNNHLSDEEHENIRSVKGLKKESTLVKKSIRNGEEGCQCLLQSFDKKEIVDKIIMEQKSRPGKRIPQRKLRMNCLHTHKEMLKDELEIYPFIDVLFEEQVLNVKEHDIIEDQATRRERIQQLVIMLSKLSNEHFNATIWALV